MSLDRPWSRVEIEERLPSALEKLDDAVVELRELGIRAATAKWEYETTWAKCLLLAEGRNVAERESIAMGLLASKRGDDGLHPGLRKDLTANAYANQRTVINALQTEMDVLRTLLVSARGEGR